MKLRTFRIGHSPRRAGELRVATTRRPPRGVPKSEWREYFDVWLPALGPSAGLLQRARSMVATDAGWSRFVRAYTREMSAADARQTIALIAAVARKMPIAIGCYCEDESRCHRSVLRQLIERSE
jgi:uncharacterized protein YeaO (DUF488 family)